MLIVPRIHGRMFCSIIGILDVDMSRLADIAHGDILNVGAESVLAAGAQARTFAHGNLADHGGNSAPLGLFLGFEPAPAVVGAGR